MPPISRNFGLLPVSGTYLVAACSLALWLWLALFPPELHLQLHADGILQAGGQAYVAPVAPPLAWLLGLPGDEVAGPEVRPRSRLMLYEDGIELGPAHSGRQSVEDEGKGRFEYDGSDLVFSASDGSDPRSNSRRYEVEDQAAPTELLNWLVGLAVAAALLLNYRRAWRQQVLSSHRLAMVTIMAPATATGRYPSVLLAVGCVLAGLAITLRDWATGQQLNFALGGWFPISDAGDWWNCAKGMEHAGSVTGFQASGICLWRPVYPALLGTLSALAGGDTILVIALQSAVVSLAAFWLLRETVRLVGPLGAAFAGILLFRYLYQFAFGQLMTENAGLAFGLTGLALLLRAADGGSKRMLALGVAALSLALTARAGALFALPLIAIWAGLAARRRDTSLWPTLALVVLAALAGPIVQAILGFAFGQGIDSSGANFSYTLYGLATGGRGWRAVLADHPELQAETAEAATRQIYGLAWAAFRSHPLALLGALGGGLRGWLLGVLSWGLVRLLQRVMVVAGLAALYRRRREPGVQLLGVVFAGEALSAPWIYDDGGQRVFAATVGADILIAALGLQFLMRGAAAVIDRKGVVAFQAMAQARVAIGPAIMVLALTGIAIAPALSLPGLLTPSAMAPPGCGPGLEGYAFQIDRGFVLRKPARGQHVDTGALSGKSSERWPPGAALVEFSSADQGAARPGLVRRVWLDAPALDRGGTVELCVGPNDGEPGPVLFGVRPVVSGRTVLRR